MKRLLTASSHFPAQKRLQVDRLLSDMVQMNIHSSEGDLLHETKLRDHLAFLMNELDLAFDKPTAAEYAIYDELHSEAAAAMKRWHQLGAGTP